MFLVGDGSFGFAHTVERGIHKVYECELITIGDYSDLLQRFTLAYDVDDYDTIHEIADFIEYISEGNLEWQDGDLFWVGA